MISTSKKISESKRQDMIRVKEYGFENFNSMNKEIIQLEI